MNEKINMQAHALAMRICGQMDAHLIESIISLFNNGVLVHYVRSPRTELDMDNLKMSVDAANGVRFEGRERIIELEKENEILKEALKFYADPENWSRRDTLFWESIDRDDCKDYPHITRDIKLTGGHRARQAFKKLGL